MNKKNLRQMLVMVAGQRWCWAWAANFFAAKPLPLFRKLPAPPRAASVVRFGEVDADFVLPGRAPTPAPCCSTPAPRRPISAGHIPGALSLPLGEFAEFFPGAGAAAAAARLLVVYCSDRTCGDSPELARRLWRKGLKNLLLYKGGMEDWQEKGNAVER